MDASLNGSDVFSSLKRSLSRRTLIGRLICMMLVRLMNRGKRLGFPSRRRSYAKAKIATRLALLRWRLPCRRVLSLWVRGVSAEMLPNQWRDPELRRSSRRRSGAGGKPCCDGEGGESDSYIVFAVDGEVVPASD